MWKWTLARVWLTWLLRLPWLPWGRGRGTDMLTLWAYDGVRGIFGMGKLFSRAHKNAKRGALGMPVSLGPQPSVVMFPVSTLGQN